MNPLNPHGFLCVNKPEGMSSFQVVKKVRALSGVKKVGHCGTLDPFATGLLILALGREYTRMISDLQGLPKVYDVTLVLGTETDTLDPEGTVVAQIPYEGPQELTHIQGVVESFIGEQEQDPPQFSAKKVNGKRAYKLARQGIEVDLKPSTITIHAIENITADFSDEQPTVSFRVTCSKGTYIRSLVRDIGRQLGCSAMTSILSREAIGSYALSESVSWDALSPESIVGHLQREKKS